MPYCSHCGAEVENDQFVCVECGHRLNSSAKNDDNNTMAVVIKVFLIIACVLSGFALIPLAWCIPMTLSICDDLKNHRPVSTGMKVCTLLFVSMIAGILLLCMQDE